MFPPVNGLNIGSSPTVGVVFLVMKAEYIVVAEQAHPLGPAYSFPIPTSYGVRNSIIVAYPHLSVFIAYTTNCSTYILK